MQNGKAETRLVATSSRSYAGQVRRRASAQTAGQQASSLAGSLLDRADASHLLDAGRWTSAAGQAPFLCRFKRLGRLWWT